MIKADELILDTTEHLLADLCGPEVVTAAEEGEWPVALWSALEDAALPIAWVPEAQGGPGAELADGFGIARIAARFAAPVPLAETLLAGWVLSRSGMTVEPGAMSIAPVVSSDSLRLTDDGKLSGRANNVSYASRAQRLAVVAQRSEQPVVALVETRDCQITNGTSIAGEPQDAVDFDGVSPVSVSVEEGDADAEEALWRMGAALRAQQIAGALERILDQSITYAKDRVQFGRPIAKFQAVQHNLARLAGEVAAAGAAADAAAVAISRHGIADERVLRAVAAAKIRAGEAAGEGAAIAHQVHGAIGFTREYSLQQCTRRLWAWRDDFGAETVWAIRLGNLVAAAGAEALWPSLTAS